MPRHSNLRGTRKPAKKGTFLRLLKMLFSSNKKSLIAVFICLTISAATGVSSSLFLNLLIKQIDIGLAKELSVVIKPLIAIFVSMGVIYLTSVVCDFFHTRIMANVTQSFLHKIRTDIFNKMQSLPIKYFDTHLTGDIMSSYTNDTDAIRQLVSQSIPQLYKAIISLSVLLVLMFVQSVWLSLVMFVGIFFMFLVTKIVGGNSAKYFVKQQKSLGAEEGFIQEMIQGQKVVKVFCHEQEAKADFDKKNEELCKDATSAHTFANILMPIMGNLGNILYVLLAFVGGLLGIKPILHVDDNGALTSVSKARGRKAALKAIADIFGDLADKSKSYPVFISHGDCIDDVKELENTLFERYGVKFDVITDIGAVIGAHAGPGTIALFFIGKNR